MSILCPAGCGKKFVNEYHIKRHLEVMHKEQPTGDRKQKGWATPYGFVDFKEPVTYEEAVSTSKIMNEMFKAHKAAKKSGESK